MAKYLAGEQSTSAHLAALGTVWAGMEWKHNHEAEGGSGVTHDVEVVLLLL